MKRLIAILLALAIACGAACAAAEEPEKPAINSYDFDFRFHLEADTYPYHERKLMQGYEELLDALEFRGNYSYCPKTDCMDMHVEIIPVNSPDAAISFRVFGWVANWLNVSSPLMGADSVCFRPKEVLNFSVRAWDFFKVPLFHFAILFPKILSNAYIELSEVWEKKLKDLKKTIPVDVMKLIEEELLTKIDTHDYVTTLIAAATKPALYGDVIKEEIRRLPELLLYAADGEPLTKKSAKTEDGERIVRYRNHRGEILYESHRKGKTSFDEALTLPGSPSDYLPAYAWHQEETEKGTSFRLDVSWDRTSEDESLPETFLRIKADMKDIPSGLFSDTEFGGEVSVEGLLLPVFHYLVKCVTGADGSVSLSLTHPDHPDKPTITCEGTVTPAEYEGKLEYMIGDIITDYNLFALGDQSLAGLLETVLPAVMDQFPDFAYAIPVHGVQSILDTLEEYRLLQVLVD